MITSEEALQIAIRRALEEGAGAEDLARMESKAERVGDFWLVSIFPGSGRETFDVSVRIDAASGRVRDVVFGTIEPEPE